MYMNLAGGKRNEKDDQTTYSSQQGTKLTNESAWKVPHTERATRGNICSDVWSWNRKSNVGDDGDCKLFQSGGEMCDVCVGKLSPMEGRMAFH